MAKHSTIERIKQGLRPLWSSLQQQKETSDRILPTMEVSLANILNEVQTLQAGLAHLQEEQIDIGKVRDAAAHLTMFAENIDLYFKRDAKLWTYLLDIVEPEIFKEGVERIGEEKLAMLYNSIKKLAEKDD